MIPLPKKVLRKAWKTYTTSREKTTWSTSRNHYYAKWSISRSKGSLPLNRYIGSISRGRDASCPDRVYAIR